MPGLWLLHWPPFLPQNEICCSAFDLPEIAEAKSFLGQGKFVRAEPLLIRALEIAKYAVGEQSTPYNELSDLLAGCKFERQLYIDAAKLYQTVAAHYLKNNSYEAAQRAISRYSTSFLRAEDATLATNGLAFVRKLSVPPSAPADLATTIGLAGLYVRSVEYHKLRLACNNSAMESLQNEIDVLVDEVGKGVHGAESIASASWHLAVGRWNQTLFEIRHEEARSQTAVDAYEKASKVGALAPLRDSDLVRADALLGLGDLARIAGKWEAADDYYKKAVELTDKHLDRDSPRVRRVIEREAQVQYHIKRWLHAEGLLRRLLDYYQEFHPLQDPAPQAQVECMRCYVSMMEARGRGSEVANLKTQLESIKTITPYPTFDPFAL